MATLRLNRVQSPTSFGADGELMHAATPRKDSKLNGSLDRNAMPRSAPIAPRARFSACSQETCNDPVQTPPSASDALILNPHAKRPVHNLLHALSRPSSRAARNLPNHPTGALGDPIDHDVQSPISENLGIVESMIVIDPDDEPDISDNPLIELDDSCLSEDIPVPTALQSALAIPGERSLADAAHSANPIFDQAGQKSFQKAPFKLNVFSCPSVVKSMIKSAIAGDTQRTQGIVAKTKQRSDGSAAIVIDGFDDAANAINGSGLSQKLAAALQACVFYPLILPFVYTGVDGALGELGAAREDFKQSKQQIEETRSALLKFIKENFNSSNVNDAMSDSAILAALPKIPLPGNSKNVEVTATLDALALYINDYRQALDHHMIDRWRCIAAPNAVAGAAGMFAGVAVYEGSALAAFFGGAASEAAASVLSTIAGATMGVSQVAMAAFGIIAAVAGARSDQELSAVRSCIEASTVLDDSTKQDLLSQKDAQKLLIRAGQIAGNLGLSAGQVMMFLGGVCGVVGLPLLAAGAVVTIASIVGKIAAQKAYDNQFTYDASAYTVDELTATQSLAEQAVKIQGDRRKILNGRALLDLLAHHLDPADAEALSAQHRTALVQLLYPNAHEDTQRAVAKRMAVSLGDFISSLDGNDGTAQCISLLVSHKGPLGQTALQKAADEFSTLNRGQRMRALYALAEECGVSTELLRLALDRLVVKNMSRNNKKGQKYAPYVVVEPGTPHSSYSFRLKELSEALEHDKVDARVEELEKAFYACTTKLIKDTLTKKQHDKLLSVNATLERLASAEILSNALKSALPVQPSESPLKKQPRQYQKSYSY